MAKSLQSSANVEVVVRVTLSQPWGEKTSIDQIYNQAKEEAISLINKAIHKEPHCTVERIHVVNVNTVLGG